MRSGTSFFNTGLAKNILRRSWPLWVSYLVIVIFMLPVSLSTRLANASVAEIDFYSIGYIVESAVFGAGETSVRINIFLGVIIAAAMFGFLYSKRGCSMIASMPIRRETVFVTTYICGIAPVILSQLIAAAVCAVIIKANTYCSTASAWQWLLYSAVCYIGFYSFGVFCAQLTGNIIALPAVYIVFNCVASVVEACVDKVLSVIVFGYKSSSPGLGILSPGAYLLSSFYHWEKDAEDGLTAMKYSVGPGLFTLVCLGAGAVFTVIALLLYKKRRMESAGDVVAVGILKPVFKYCMSFGTSLVLVTVLFSSFIDLSNLLYGTARYFLVLAIMLAGAAIGYFTAEMMIQKTVRVFPCRVKGLLISCAVIITLTALAELDVFGTEQYIPDLGEIESVDVYTCINYDDTVLYGEEGIELARALHREIIDDKKELEKSTGAFVNITYYIKDGSTLQRSYQLPRSTETAQLYTLEQVQNCPEAIIRRASPDTGDRQWLITSGDVVAWIGEDSQSLQLTPEEAQELYTRCLLPDAQDGNICISYAVPDGDRENEQTNTTVTVYYYEYESANALNAPDTAVQSYAVPWSFVINYTVNIRSQRTLEWLRDCGIKVCTEAEANEKYQ